MAARLPRSAAARFYATLALPRPLRSRSFRRRRVCLANPLRVFGVGSQLPTLCLFGKLKSPLVLSILDLQLFDCRSDFRFFYARKLVGPAVAGFIFRPGSLESLRYLSDRKLFLRAK